MKPYIKILIKLSKYLGDDHDIVILKKTINTNPDLFSNEKKCIDILNIYFDKRCTSLRKRAKPILDRFYIQKSDMWIKQFELLWTLWK